MKTFVQEGNLITTVVPPGPGPGVKSGDVLVIGNLAGIAATDGAPGEQVELALTGCYRLPKGAGGLNQGAVVTWNAQNGVIATAGAGNLCLGLVIADAANEDSTALVRLGGVNVTVPGAA
jgi:predicted RecA/RadA family phage recombinase